jgi:methionine-S-sulfoxide reductase
MGLGLGLGVVRSASVALLGLVACLAACDANGTSSGRTEARSAASNAAASNPAASSTAKTANSSPASSAAAASQPVASNPASNPVSSSTPAMPTSSTTSIATFGAGCFWGVEHIFKDVAGVSDAVSGYSGGTLKNPTYQQICNGDTGHAEVVQVTFDPAKVSYEALVDIFFRLHDPTQVNGQGPDIGDQYRSVIHYHDDAQKATAEKVKAARAPKYKRPIATSIEAASKFYAAEDYHQDYYVKTGKQPYCHYLRPE